MQIIIGIAGKLNHPIIILSIELILKAISASITIL